MCSVSSLRQLAISAPSAPPPLDVLRQLAPTVKIGGKCIIL